ncbi:MAG: manganese efflux pump [bacterium]
MSFLLNLLVYVLPFLLAVSYFSVSLSNARLGEGVKPGTPLKAAIIFSLVAGSLFAGGYFVAGALARRTLGTGEWVVLVMFMITGIRMVIHAWKRKADEKVYDINLMPVIFALAFALGINMLFAGVGVRFMDLSMVRFTWTLSLIVLFLSFSGLMFGLQFRDSFARAMELIAGIGIAAAGILYYFSA